MLQGYPLSTPLRSFFLQRVLKILHYVIIHEGELVKWLIFSIPQYSFTSIITAFSHSLPTINTLYKLCLAFERLGE